MLNQVKISQSVLLGKTYASVVVAEITARKLYGDDVSSLESRLILVTRWITILEDFLTNYEDSGELNTDTCLTLTQILELISKMEVIAGDTQVAFSNWILSTGFWNDSSVWNDSETWID